MSDVISETSLSGLIPIEPAVVDAPNFCQRGSIYVYVAELVESSEVLAVEPDQDLAVHNQPEETIARLHDVIDDT